MAIVCETYIPAGSLLFGQYKPPDCQTGASAKVIFFCGAIVTVSLKKLVPLLLNIYVPGATPRPKLPPEVIRTRSTLFVRNKRS